MLISALMLSSRIEQFLIVKKSRWTYEHIAVFFDAGVRKISFHFEGAWLSGLFPVIVHSLKL